MTPLLYLLFGVSGLAGLVYQVVWVREFGHAFGNTLHSASIVIAIFMLGLGGGSYIVGRWADRRYHTAPESLLRVYAGVELAIALLGAGIAFVLPHLPALVAALSAYEAGADGWFTLTAGSYAARAAIAVVLLAPITMLMGGTLTLLIRFSVRADLRVSGWMIALLYAVNTLGAAAGAFLTDFALVPGAGLFATQLMAVGLNVAAGAGAWWLAGRRELHGGAPQAEAVGRKLARSPRRAPAFAPSGAAPTPYLLTWVAVALALSGFAALGVEILWLRHMTLLLGGFRAVFSLMMAVMLVALAAGALFGGWLDRRGRHPAETFMVVQALFVITFLAGLGRADVAAVLDSGRSVGPQLAGMGTMARALAETWYNLRPMLFEIGVPAFFAGCAFPLGNAIVQRAEDAVGARAGALYLANTAGAVLGSLAAGYVLLPWLGIQSAATVLAAAGALALLPLYLAARRPLPSAATAIAVTAALAVWMALPPGHVLQRSLSPQQAGERVIVTSEGSTELIAVVERPGSGRGLITNGHAMSSTAPLDQRYMRAMAHIPLLSMASPVRALVIGFGVGNTTHAVSLHPSVERIDVADLSRHVLEQAPHFRDANAGVLQDPRVAVYLNDGRQHLRMVEAGAYDLITLEPPPIAHAGVASLYSREFYELARTRLAAGGYISQWLPAYQVPADASLAMVRAFLDVFPQSVLLSGMQAELILVGTTAPRIEIDPDALARRIAAPSPLRADLDRLDLGTPREIIGTFVGSADTMARATAGVAPVTDDRPLQEYGVQSTLGTVLTGVPASLFDLSAAGHWCGRCFEGEGGGVGESVAGLDLYLALLSRAYSTPPRGMAPSRVVLGSAYLGAVLPDTPEVRDIVGGVHLRAGSGLLEAGELDAAETELRDAVRYMPGSAEAHNDLGVVLASTGRIAEARPHFAEAVRLQPAFTEARNNLMRAGG